MANYTQTPAFSMLGALEKCRDVNSSVKNIVFCDESQPMREIMLLASKYFDSFVHPAIIEKSMFDNNNITCAKLLRPHFLMHASYRNDIIVNHIYDIMNGKYNIPKQIFFFDAIY